MSESTPSNSEGVSLSAQEETSVPERIENMVAADNGNASGEFRDSWSELKKSLLTLYSIGIQDDNNTLKTFTLFPRLPIELRFKIWQQAVLDPGHRAPDVTARRSVEVASINFGIGYQTFPRMLHACREARAEGARVYKIPSKREMKDRISDFFFYVSMISVLESDPRNEDDDMRIPWAMGFIGL